jgi:hypothetical protein
MKNGVNSTEEWDQSAGDGSEILRRKECCVPMDNMSV